MDITGILITPVCCPVRCQPNRDSSCHSQSPVPQPRGGQSEGAPGRCRLLGRSGEWSFSQRTGWTRYSLEGPRRQSSQNNDVLSLGICLFLINGLAIKRNAIFWSFWDKDLSHSLIEGEVHHFQLISWQTNHNCAQKEVAQINPTLSSCLIFHCTYQGGFLTELNNIDKCASHSFPDI